MFFFLKILEPGFSLRFSRSEVLIWGRGSDMWWKGHSQLFFACLGCRPFEDDICLCSGSYIVGDETKHSISSSGWLVVGYCTNLQGFLGFGIFKQDAEYPARSVKGSQRVYFSWQDHPSADHLSFQQWDWWNLNINGLVDPPKTAAFRIARTEICTILWLGSVKPCEVASLLENCGILLIRSNTQSDYCCASWNYCICSFLFCSAIVSESGIIMVYWFHIFSTER